jgi:hypothetical protein
MDDGLESHPLCSASSGLRRPSWLARSYLTAAEGLAPLAAAATCDDQTR